MGFSMHSTTDFNTGMPTKTPRHHFMMYTARARAAFQYQQFFFEQREKLSSMLNAVSADARAASSQQQVCMDYYELTSVVTQLLSDAQVFSALTYDQLDRQGVQMQPFAEKVQMVESVATELRLRACASQKSVSKKRGRRMDDDEDEEEIDIMDTTPAPRKYAVKRYRRAPVDQEMFVEPAFCGPYADRFLQNAWWNQPIYE